MSDLSALFRLAGFATPTTWLSNGGRERDEQKFMDLFRAAVIEVMDEESDRRDVYWRREDRRVRWLASESRRIASFHLDEWGRGDVLDAELESTAQRIDGEGPE